MFGNKESNRLSIRERYPKLMLVAIVILSQLALFSTYGNLYATSNEDDNRELGIQCKTGSEDVCLVDACMGHPCIGYNNYNGGFERDFDVAITKHTIPDLNYLDQDSASSTLHSAADNCLESSSNIQYISTNGLGNSNDDEDDNDDEGTVFAKLLDHDYDTKWQEEGFGSFIQMDLGSVQTVCSLGIAWDKGDERSYNFIISTSNDGTTFTDVLRGTSSGSTEAIENYDIADDQSRLIRVTVLGNDDESDDEHDMAAINEIRVGTSAASSTSHNSPSNEQLVLSQPTSNANNSAALTNSTEITPDSYLSKLTDIMKIDRLHERTQNQFIDTNLAPSVEDLNIRAAAVSSVEIELKGTDPNSAAQSLEFSVNDLPMHGILKPGSSQDSVLYYPNPGFVGPDSFTYRAIDDQGLESALGTVHIVMEN
jgi:hypothetical protein